MIRKLIILIILTTPLLAIAQDPRYVRITKRIGNIPQNAKLLLVASKDSQVLYFKDTISIEKKYLKPVSVSNNIGAEAIFFPDISARGVRIEISKLIDNNDSISLTDSTGKLIYAFKRKNDTLFSASIVKFRLTGNKIPDIFYTYPPDNNVKAAGQPDSTNEEIVLPKKDNTSFLPSWALPTLAGIELLAILFLLFTSNIMGKKRKKTSSPLQSKENENETRSGFRSHPDQEIAQQQPRPNNFEYNVTDKLNKIETIVKSLSSSGSEGKTKIGTIEKQLSDKSAELIGATETIKTLTHEKETLSGEINFYSNKFLRAEELTPTAEKLVILLEAIRAVYQKAVDLQDSTGNFTGPEAKHIALFLNKHARATDNLKIDRWENICSLLIETGCIADRKLKPILSIRSGDPEYVTKQFRIEANRDLIRYIDATMILTEECQNLDRFVGRNSGAASNAFFQSIEKLKSTALDALDISIPSVRLFTDYENYSNIKVVDDPLNPLYETVTDLPRNHIIEIKTFGVGLAGEEDKYRTKIVIKK